ncbi:MAG: succinate dehydrogenase [Burkholderiales bacterium]|nr:succinate dehydrogenase [Burkholderiales bacterium]MDP2399391.1 succinate dehydrogenase [Burkholderiales bacterium]
MSRRSEVLLWGAQRISAMVLALCVIVHLLTMIYAVRSGLSAAEILGRTQGNVAWFAFYTLFVAAVAVHAPIGMRTIISEMFNWRGRGLDVLTAVMGLSLAMWGMRAVFAVFGGGA